MRGLQGLFGATLLVCGVAFVIWQGLTHPDSPVPREWNPLKRLYLDDPVSFLTPYKLDAAVSDPQICLDVLEAGGARFTPLPPLEVSEQCHIRNRVRLAGVGGATLDPLEISCDTALRLAAWERYGLQPLAQELFGTSVRKIHHFSSYNCRMIRGSSSRVSTHATAEAIDVSALTLDDGRRIDLKRDWDGTDDVSKYLKWIRDDSCRWFSTVLGPDYNALHADHFHLQSNGWGTCR
jgi:hypothetical protein